MYSSSAQLFNVILVTSLVGLCVRSAPQAQPLALLKHQEDGIKLESKSIERKADLIPLINETLKINKLNHENEHHILNGNQSFRDDWTFDMVEYDLMDFLQELNARYLSNKNSTIDKNSDKPLLDFDHSNLEVRKDSNKADISNQAELVKINLTTPNPVVANSNTSSCNNSSISYITKINEIGAKSKQEVVIDGNNNDSVDSKTKSISSSTTLPISLAPDDHDLSESTWQYGIFDRFTRPRASSTTPHPADSLAMSGSGTTLDVRSFNSDECGLRSYRENIDHFPTSEQLETDEITKELSQRRQRPPLGSSFFQSHKKYHHTAADPIFDQDLDNNKEHDILDTRNKLLPPPFDRYGEPANSNYRLNYSSISAAESSNSQTDSIFSNPTENVSNSDSMSEFNLSSRRQWLQQQLGSTLQMLGFNSTNPSSLDYMLMNGQAGSPTGLRENMMKMSANKLGKSIGDKSIDLSKLTGPEITEQELNARQDELKLEARVIGGNDARLGDSPWSVSLQALVSRPGTGGVEYRHYCGGTIISEYFILTAAHCLDFMVGRESRLFVVVGDLNWRMSAASLHGRRFGIEKLIIHGGYKSTAFGHDIGLIKTKESMKPLKVNGRYIINSVCLPEKNIEHSGEAELVGWGLFSNRNEMADSLQIADVPILPRPLCVDLYRRRTGLIQWLIGIELITEKQICAGTFGRGICQGDSGSALVFNEKVQLEAKASSARLRNQLTRDAQQKATIIGIVAFGGIRRCSYQSLPGVYMQTSKYLDWILPRIQ